MWALYFIPRWLRRHEELSESRSVEKFDNAMRILSRREPTADKRYVVMPARPADDEAGSGKSRSTRALRRKLRRKNRRRTSLAVRRRRIVAVLVLLTVVVGVAAPFTAVPWWGPVAFAFLDVLYLAHLRSQERRRREVSRSRDSVRARTRSRMRRFQSAERIGEARRIMADQRAAAEAARVQAEWAAHEEARLAADRAASDGWEPTPVPLPTYVTKPVARRATRPLDLGRSGSWSEAEAAFATAGKPLDAADEAVFDQTASSRETASAGQATYDDYTEELDAILERRRAVGD
jgi:hypothetical protein